MNIQSHPYDMDRLDWREFEERVARYFAREFGSEFDETQLPVGPEQEHKFDLVSSDGSIIIECKSYTWTDSHNFPAAKVSTANEALFFLSRVDAERKMLVMQDDLNRDGRSLVKTYVERYRGLMDDTEVWRYLPQDSVDEDVVEQVKQAGDVYYESL